MALARAVALLPRALLPFFGAVLGFIACDVLRIRREHVVAAMARADIGGRGGKAISVARQFYRGLGTSALELLWIAGHRAPIAPLVRIDGWERFEAARAAGRGVIVATAHTGNWDLTACACAERVDLAVVTKRLHARGVDAFWQGTRGARGVRLIPEHAGALSLARAHLARGGAVALLIDQDPERHHGVVDAPFLGADALLDTLAATLAARTGAPIVAAFGCRDAQGEHVVEIVDVLTPPARAGSAWIAGATRSLAASLESFVRARPASWLWLHRRWKTRPVRGARASAA